MIEKLENQKHKEIAKGFFAKFIHSEKMTMAYLNVVAKASVPEHKHENEQITSVISGRFKFTIAGEEYIMEAGDVVVIPPNVLHGGVALTDCFIIDTFTPVREDLKRM